MTKAKRIPTKTTRIRKMLELGASVKDIAKRLNVSPQFVYSVRYKDRVADKKAKPVAKSSVAPKHVPPPQPYKITTTELLRIQEQNRHLHEQRINKLPYGVEVSPEPVGVFALITKYLRKWFA
jgi:transposase